MSNRKKLVVPVESSAEFGLYVWELPNGQLFADDDGNLLNVPSLKYDLRKMRQLADAAKYYGRPEGKAVFLAGVGRSTESQRQEDIQRMADGLTPYGDTENWAEVFRADGRR